MARTEEFAKYLVYRPGAFPATSSDVAMMIGRQTYVMAEKDLEVLRFLDLLVYVRSLDRKLQIVPHSLLTHRDDFRRIIAAKPIAGLLNCVTMRLNVEQRRLASWLLSCCANRSVAPTLVDVGRPGPNVLRREVAKALWRLDACRDAQRLASATEDERTLRLAGLTGRRFDVILRKWRVNDDAAVAIPKRPFELLVPIGEDAPRRPKSREIIRRFLEHIRFLLRGSA